MNQLKKALREPFWLVVGALFVLEAVLTPRDYFPADQNVLIQWIKQLNAHGLGTVYELGGYNDYPPLIYYPLWLWGKSLGDGERLNHYFYLFKLLPLAFDFAAAVLIAQWAGKQRQIAHFLLIAANPLFIYNSYYWGQFDSIFCALTLFSLFAALRDRPVWALLFFTLALNCKIQAIVFAPPLALVFFWKFRDPWPLRRVAAALGATALLQFAILLPFLCSGQLANMATLIWNSLGRYHVLSMHAFNFWQFLLGHDSYTTGDDIVLACGLSAKAFGIILFCGFSFAVLAPFLWQTARAKIRGEKLAVPDEKFLLMFALIALGFFFFNTEMHERYAHPLIFFLAAYAFITRRYLWFALALAAYTLGLEYVMKYYQLDSYKTWIFTSNFIPALYAILFVPLLYYYFRTGSPAARKESFTCEIVNAPK